VEQWNVSQWLRISLLVLILLGILFLLMQISPWLQFGWQLVKAVLGPFFIAMVISYLLNPVVNLLSERNVPRSLAVLLIYSLFITSIVILILQLAPLFELQLKELTEHLPEWSARIQSMINEVNHSKEFLPISVQNGIEKSLSKMEMSISNYVGEVMSGIGSTINQMFLALIIPFMAFYMMKDIHSIERSFISLVPRGRRRELVRLIRDLDQALGNYIRGQLLVCTVVGVLVYIGYKIVGVPYALLLAVIVAVFNVIPYMGPIFGAIPACLVALTISFRMLIGVLIVNLIVQTLEGNVISPQIVGRTLHIHPLWIIFAVLVGGELAGVLGLILAVPVFAMGKVVLDHIVEHFAGQRV